MTTFDTLRLFQDQLRIQGRRNWGTDQILADNLDLFQPWGQIRPTTLLLHTAHRSILIGEGTHTILSTFDYVLWHKQLSDRVLPLTFVLVIYCANKYNSI